MKREKLATTRILKRILIILKKNNNALRLSEISGQAGAGYCPDDYYKDGILFLTSLGILKKERVESGYTYKLAEKFIVVSKEVKK